MLTFLCPHCDTEIPAEARAIGSLPPTGGDYDWQEGDKTHTCPNCQNKFDMRVRTGIGTGSLLKINQSPKPQKPDIVWYAVAALSRNIWSKEREEKLVYVAGVYKNLADAEAKLAEYNENLRQYTGIDRILKVTNMGYFDLEGNNIPEPTYYASLINYS